tara:strand:+ start:208 stop:393 length:186 start_codon:yes stop_codon:yes gene_type:complete
MIREANTNTKTVAWLIDQLQQFDPSSEIIMNDYGKNDIYSVEFNNNDGFMGDGFVTITPIS